MSRSKKNWDQLVDFDGNYFDVDRDVGVARISAGKNIAISPDPGIGNVTIAVDDNGTLIQQGDDLSHLVNDVGYLTEVSELNEIKDVEVPSPQRNYVLTWNGTKWIARAPGAPESFLYRGKKDVATEHPEADPEEGWTYVHDGADGATPLASWVGIAGETVDINDLIIYATSGWTVVKGTFDSAGFKDLTAANSPTSNPGNPGGYLDYDPATALLTFYPSDLGVLPDPTDPNPQPGTLDDRYVEAAGDSMTGDLTLGLNDISDIKDITLAGSIIVDGYTATPGSTPKGHIIGVGGSVVFGFKDNLGAPTVIAGEFRRKTNADAYLFLASDPVDDEHATTKRYVDNLSDALEADIEARFVLSAGDSMTGTLVFDNVAKAMQIDGSTKIGIESNASVTFESNDESRLEVAAGYVQVSNQPFNVVSDDDKVTLSVVPGATLGDSYARYEGQTAHKFDVTNKAYVDQGDKDLEDAIDTLDAKVDGLELGIPEAEADAKYLQEIVVDDTITVDYPNPAEVIADNKNELTFKIPSGQKGELGPKGERGFKGDRGTVGNDGNFDDLTQAQKDSLKGDPGINGTKGDTGQKGQSGSNGSNGSKGQKGAAGAAGSSGSFVGRGNTGSNIRIYYSLGNYYIAGTS